MFAKPNSLTTVTSYANLWWNNEFVLKGDNFRIARQRSDNDNREVLLKNAREWTVYSEMDGDSRASIWTTDQLPGKLPLDPREFVCDSLDERVIEVLREHRIISTERIRDDRGRDLIRIVTRRGPGATERCWDFDPQQNLLPVRRFNSWPDDESLLEVVEIEYQDAHQERAWFPFRLVRRFYDKGAAIELDSPEWRQQIEWIVTKFRAYDVASEDVTPGDLKVEFKSGTRVTDNIRHRIYRTP